MASLEYKALELMLKITGMKKTIDKAFDRGIFNQGDVPYPPKQLQKTMTIEKKTVNQRNVFILSPKQGNGKTVILYLHGGAYVFGFKKIHWDLFRTLIQETGCIIVAPDYPLAPIHTFEDTYAMIIPIYQDLIDRYGCKNMILMGDSSGGGLALGLAQTMSKENRPSVSQIILLSPWLDLSLSDPESLALDGVDPILSISGLKRAAKAYAGSADIYHYQLSPLYGNVHGLGTITLFIGTKDLLLADARRFKRFTLEEGVTINVMEIKDMVHVGMLLPLPQSKPVINQIIALIKHHADRS